MDVKLYPPLREEIWLRVFDNKVLRRMSGPKREHSTLHLQGEGGGSKVL
jgi:hypothetical protein